jgi:hypothetical protein
MTASAAAITGHGVDIRTMTGKATVVNANAAPIVYSNNCDCPLSAGKSAVEVQSPNWISQTGDCVGPLLPEFCSAAAALSEEC